MPAGKHQTWPLCVPHLRLTVESSALHQTAQPHFSSSSSCSNAYFLMSQLPSLLKLSMVDFPQPGHFQNPGVSTETQISSSKQLHTNFLQGLIPREFKHVTHYPVSVAFWNLGANLYDPIILIFFYACKTNTLWLTLPNFAVGLRCTLVPFYHSCTCYCMCW